MLRKSLGGIGIVLLLLMAGLHMSGFGFVTDRMKGSDAPDFLKDIFPVLFASASLQLIALAAFAFVGLRYSHARRVTLSLVVTFTLINAGFCHLSRPLGASGDSNSGVHMPWSGFGFTRASKRVC